MSEARKRWDHGLQSLNARLDTGRQEKFGLHGVQKKKKKQKTEHFFFGISCQHLNMDKFLRKILTFIVS